MDGDVFYVKLAAVLRRQIEDMVRRRDPWAPKVDVSDGLADSVEVILETGANEYACVGWLCREGTHEIVKVKYEARRKDSSQFALGAGEECECLGTAKWKLENENQEHLAGEMIKGLIREAEQHLAKGTRAPK